MTWWLWKNGFQLSFSLSFPKKKGKQMALAPFSFNYIFPTLVSSTKPPQVRNYLQHFPSTRIHNTFTIFCFLPSIASLSLPLSLPFS
jgi:hypothetical protein